MIRLFVGLELPKSVKASLARLCCGVDGARWQTDDQFHLTLRFIGEVETPCAEDIRHSLETIRFAPFDLRLSRLGMFGKASRPRSLWAGVEDDASLHHLHDKIDQCLEGCGIPPDERKYSPHVTLARMRGRSVRAARYVAAHNDFATSAFPVTHMSLYQSHLGNEGAHYEVLARYPAIGNDGLVRQLELEHAEDMYGYDTDDLDAYGEWVEPVR